MKVDTNVETDGRFHSNWLNMMYSRLLIARQLLKEDGVIFISIDDNEVHHLRKLCDEVFGQENFIADIIWQKKYSPQNDAKYFSQMHDHIICYAKQRKFNGGLGWTINLLDRTQEQNERYSNPDDDKRGDWKPSDLSVKSYNDAYDYPITTPSGRIVNPPQGRCWVTSEDKYNELVNDNRIWFGKSGNNVPSVKKFLTEVKQGTVPQTIWFYEDVGHTDESRKELKSLFENPPFDNPKPTKLINRILKLALNENDIIIDFFGGSGTTGHSVLESNVEKKTNKFILIQLPEATGPKSEAYKAGYKKISDITIERNKRVIEKIIAAKKAEQPDLFTNDKKEDALKGLGFKVFKLQKSNFPRTEFAPDPEKSEKENIDLLKKYISEKEAQMLTAFNKDELITEILIKKGYELNYTKTKKEEFKKNELFHVTDGNKETLICLDGSLDKETVEYFKQNPKENLIVLERALDTTKNGI